MDINELLDYLDNIDSKKAHKDLKNRFKKYEDVILSPKEAKILIKHPICKLILQSIFTEETIITEKYIEKRIGNNKMLNAICNAFIEENHIEIVRLLSKKEELELAKRMAAGDKEAREKLIHANTGLVKSCIVRIAKRYNLLDKNFYSIYEDLFQDGMEALIKSLDKYDYTKGCRISTYVFYGIQKAIYSSIEKQMYQLGLSQGKIDEIKRMNKIQNELTIELGVKPNTKQIADRLEIEEERVKENLQLRQGMISLDSFSEETNLYEVIGDEKINIEEEYEIKELYQILANLILHCLEKKRITQKEFLVLCLKFGLVDERVRTDEQIGKILNVSEQRAAQILKKCIEKLREYKKIKDFGNENNLWGITDKKKRIVHSIAELKEKYPALTDEQLKEGVKILTARQKEVLIIAAGENLDEEHKIKSSTKEYMVLRKVFQELEKYVTRTLKLAANDKNSDEKVLGNVRIIAIKADQINWMSKTEMIAYRKYNTVNGDVISSGDVKNILENKMEDNTNKDRKNCIETTLREALLIVLLNKTKEAEMDYEALLPFIKSTFAKRLQEMYPEIDSKKIKIAIDEVLTNYLGEQQFTAKVNLYPKRTFAKKS